LGFEKSYRTKKKFEKTGLIYQTLADSCCFFKKKNRLMGTFENPTCPVQPVQPVPKVIKE